VPEGVFDAPKAAGGEGGQLVPRGGRERGPLSGLPGVVADVFRRSRSVGWGRGGARQARIASSTLVTAGERKKQDHTGFEKAHGSSTAVSTDGFKLVVKCLTGVSAVTRGRPARLV